MTYHKMASCRKEYIRKEQGKNSSLGFSEVSSSRLFLKPNVLHCTRGHHDVRLTSEDVGYKKPGKLARASVRWQIGWCLHHEISIKP